MDSAPYIEISHLSKYYELGGERIKALDDFSLEIAKGETIGIFGTSGSGKSTLLNCLAGLERPTKGSIRYGKIAIEKLSEREITLFRQHNVGFVFQSYNLIPTLSAWENVSLGLLFRGVPKKEREEEARVMLERVGLGSRMHHRPKELSGGQQQRVSIARAFVGSPKVVFADEPTGNLDSATTIEIMNLMHAIIDEKKITMIVVTHDEELNDFVDRTIHMRDGKITKMGMGGKSK